MAKLSAGAALLVACVLPAGAADVAGTWQPPIGVPPPPFGIVEQAGEPTVYVDDTHPEATDDGNPTGSAQRPRRTMPSSLPAGAVVQVRGGPYSVGNVRWTLSGSGGAPVFVKGVGTPVFRGRQGQIILAGSHFVIEGFVFEGVKLRLDPGATDVAIRSNEIRNWGDRGPTAMIGVPGAQRVVILRNHIHDNGDIDSTRELDILGVAIGEGAQHVWVVDNHIHHIGGDSVRVGDNRPGARAPSRFVYIGRNDFHHNQENALDVKLAADVVVSQNLMYGFRPPRSGSDSGTALVVHYDPQRVWVLYNRIHSAATGIRCTGAVDGFYVIGNVVWNIRHPAGSPYDPDSTYSSHAIMAYSTPSFYAINNTVYGSDAGISHTRGERTEIVNNVVAGLTERSHHVAVASSTPGQIAHNLLGPQAMVRIGTRVRNCGEARKAFPRLVQGCLDGDPRFVDTSRDDFHLKPGSPARDAGTDHPAYGRFRELYGLDIRRDADGRPRPAGRAFDLGAYEAAH